MTDAAVKHSVAVDGQSGGGQPGGRRGRDGSTAPRHSEPSRVTSILHRSLSVRRVGERNTEGHAHRRDGTLHLLASFSQTSRTDISRHRHRSRKRRSQRTLSVTTKRGKEFVVEPAAGPSQPLQSFPTAPPPQPPNQGQGRWQDLQGQAVDEEASGRARRLRQDRHQEGAACMYLGTKSTQSTKDVVRIKVRHS